MKKVFLIILCLCFLVNNGYAKEVAVVYKPDKSVAIIHPARCGDIHEIVAETVTGTELEGLEYEIMESIDLPDRSTRNGWEKEKGKPFKINQAKVNEFNKKTQIAEKIKELNEKAAKQALGYEISQ